MTVFDVGAHAGYYTLAFSSIVGASGNVVAFEPNNISAENLRRHIQLNNRLNIRPIEAAVANKSGTALFNDQGYGSSLSKTGRRHVATVKLDDFPAPDFVKMDIEGAEGLALEGAQHILSANNTEWFIALHDKGARTRALDILRSHKLSISWITPHEIIARPN
jgi:FkbM family methyltransferase